MPGNDDPEIYQAALEGLLIGLYLVDAEQRIFFWNTGAEQITGYLRQEVLGRYCRENFLGKAEHHDNVLSGAALPIARALRDGAPAEALVTLRHKTGRPVQVRLRAAPIRNRDGKIIGAAESFEGVGLLMHGERRTSKLAVYGCVDMQTGAVNQGYTQAQLREHLELFLSHQIPFCILSAQVDDLEGVRHRHGSGAAAAVMRVVATTIATSLRPNDIVGRWTETEFLAIAAECHEREVAKVAHRVQNLVNCAETEWWGDEIRVTVSVGCSAATKGDTAESVVERARQALRTGLESGGAKITVAKAGSHIEK